MCLDGRTYFFKKEKSLIAAITFPDMRSIIYDFTTSFSDNPLKHGTLASTLIKTKTRSF
jgi:hypothetical protein